MQREEVEMFPLLEQHLCQQQQRAIVWRTLRWGGGQGGGGEHPESVGGG